MKITENEFGIMPGGNAINLYTLRNKNSIQVKIINYGGTITSISTPDYRGEFANIVLGFDDLNSYLDDHPYFGALIGRYGNRIAKGRFSIHGKEYQLSINDGENHLHGGIKGFDKVVWNAQIEDNSRLKLTYLSKDGEEGYPGNLNVSIIYELTDEDELIIIYQAETDQSTPVNLTAHSYFNLSEQPSSTILDHRLKLQSAYYTPVNEQLIPTGKIEPVKNTAFDFSEYRAIGEHIDKVNGGYDHNFVVKEFNGSLKEIAKVHDPESRRELSVFSTEPGFQFYSGNFLDGTFKTKEGIEFNKHSGFCIEPQKFPDSPNHENFPVSILEPGDFYKSKTVYRFGLI
jgi:aldose 1-epimerase